VWLWLLEVGDIKYWEISNVLTNIMLHAHKSMDRFFVGLCVCKKPSLIFEREGVTVSHVNVHAGIALDSQQRRNFWENLAKFEID
jgi:hypothetical protein